MDNLEFINFRDNLVKDDPADIHQLVERAAAILGNPDVAEIYKQILKNDKTISKFIELGLVEIR